MTDERLAFTFATATRIIFGRGKAVLAADEIAGLGRHAFLVHGSTDARARWLIDSLAAKGVSATPFACGREPDLDLLNEAVAVARDAGADVVVSLGGGAAIDLGKAVAALSEAGGDTLDYLEVVGQGLTLPCVPLPFVALPTTSGTGAEVTKNAVIGVPADRRKVSLRDPRMLADLALVDPALTDDSPRAVTLASGLDAITQVIEPYICTRAWPMTDALCRDAIPRGLSALVRLMESEDPGARDDMALTSLFGGLALANAGLGAVHGLAGVIGGVVEAPHGAICGALLPHVLSANADEATDSSERIGDVQRLVCNALELDDFARFAGWIGDQGLPRLSEMGVRRADHAAIAEAAQASSSMAANPRRLSVRDLGEILVQAG